MDRHARGNSSRSGSDGALPVAEARAPLLSSGLGPGIRRAEHAMRLRMLASILAAFFALAPAVRAETEVSILTLNLWHWQALPQAAAPNLLATLDDLPAPGAGGPTFIAFQEALLPLLETGLTSRGYHLTHEPAISAGIAKLTASRTPPHHARGYDRSGLPCTAVCDAFETCTLVDAQPLCLINVHSQAWQLGKSEDDKRLQLSFTLLARARELARGGFRVYFAGDFNAPVDAESIRVLENAGFDDAWRARSLPECSPAVPLGCTLVANPFDAGIVGPNPPDQVPDHRRIDHLYAFGAASGDGWQSASIQFDGGANGPRVSGQNGVLAAHGGPGAFAPVTPVGEYDVSLACSAGCSGVYPHRMSVETWDPVSGQLRGTGYYVNDPSIRWTVEGTTNGSAFSLTYTYLEPNAGFVGTAAGSLDGTGAPATGTGGSATHGLSYAWTATRRSPTATYAVEMTACAPGACPGASHPHTMVIDAWNPATGQFSGRGRSDVEPQRSWTVAGRVAGTRFELDFAYQNLDAGRTGSVVGSIDPDGRLRFGLGLEEAAPVNRFGFHATAVPEPSLGILVGVGSLALAARARRRRAVAR